MAIVTSTISPSPVAGGRRRPYAFTYGTTPQLARRRAFKTRCNGPAKESLARLARIQFDTGYAPGLEWSHATIFTNSQAWIAGYPPVKKYHPPGSATPIDVAAFTASTQDGFAVLRTAPASTERIWAIAIYRYATSGATADYRDCVILFQPTSTDAINLMDRPPTPGQWFYKARTFTDDGQWGTPSDEVSLTI